ncbi:MAG: hypothetical protein FGM26_07660 [Beijerinckiaceae bacterium]|nr:hypothetical protein [Beijerinckiaceae bacterium]
MSIMSLSAPSPRAEAFRLIGVIAAITALDMVMSFGLSLWTLTGASSPGIIGYVVTGLSLGLGGLAAILVLQRQLLLARKLLFVLVVLIILEIAASTFLMVQSLAAYSSGPGGFALLIDGGLLWLLNGLTFGLTYWLLDGDLWSTRRSGYRDFFFPQQMQNLPGYTDWHADLFAYLFLAYCLNTAFSPTDTVIASKRGKVFVMMQSTIGLVLFTITIARSVNILR